MSRYYAKPSLDKNHAAIIGELRTVGEAAAKAVNILHFAMKFDLIKLTTNRTKRESGLTTYLKISYSEKALAGVFRFPIRRCFGSAEKDFARAFSFGEIMSKRICCFEGCGAPHKAQNYCKRHYQLLTRSKVLTINKNLKCKTLQEKSSRFWGFVDKSNECWLWTGRRNSAKYGVTTNKIGNTTYYFAHRFSYFLTYGDFSQHLHVLHSCDNPPCCNPKHLFLGTDADNVADKVAKNRHLQGEQIPSSKLTEDQVIQMRHLYLSSQASYASLSVKFDVNPKQIRNIIKRKAWKHI